MKLHQRRNFVLLIANDLVMLLAKEPEQAEALLELAVEIDFAAMAWVIAWEKGEK
jgi:hypothetical protein